MNTLAVIEAGDRVGEQQVSTAMTAIAMLYTLGSVLGPIATGATVSYVSEHGLMISVGIVSVLFIVMLILRRAPCMKVQHIIDEGLRVHTTWLWYARWPMI